MKTIKKLWKVVIAHKMGAHAPSYFVNTEYVATKSKSTKENKDVEILMALEKAKQLTRLSDFPNDWKIEVVNTEKYLKNGKWYI